MKQKVMHLLIQFSFKDNDHNFFSPGKRPRFQGSCAILPSQDAYDACPSLLALL